MSGGYLEDGDDDDSDDDDATISIAKIKNKYKSGGAAQQKGIQDPLPHPLFVEGGLININSHKCQTRH